MSSVTVRQECPGGSEEKILIIPGVVRWGASGKALLGIDIST